MNISEASIVETSNTKMRVWTLTQISLASYIAGPFGGCYLLSQNAKLFGNSLLAKRLLLIGLISTLLLILATMTIGVLVENIWDRIPKFLVPSIYTGVIVGYVQGYQNKRIKELQKAGIKRRSYFRLIFDTAWIAAASILCAYFFAFLAVIIADTFHLQL